MGGSARCARVGYVGLGGERRPGNRAPPPPMTKGREGKKHNDDTTRINKNIQMGPGNNNYVRCYDTFSLTL